MGLFHYYVDTLLEYIISLFLCDANAAWQLHEKSTENMGNLQHRHGKRKNKCTLNRSWQIDSIFVITCLVEVELNLTIIVVDNIERKIPITRIGTSYTPFVTLVMFVSWITTPYSYVWFATVLSHGILHSSSHDSWFGIKGFLRPVCMDILVLQNQ
jgi:hypothetical protein